MAWIESHQGLARHLKTKRFARKLGVSIPSAIGHLHLLWWWALDNLPDGNLSVMEPEDIADEMMWNNDPKVLITALVDSGFADELDGFLFIHDWHDYIGRLLEKRKKETDRKREYRRKSEEKEIDIPVLSQGCPTGQDAEVTKDGGRNSTVPYLTIPDNKEYVPFSEIITYLNLKLGTNYKASTVATKHHINARWTQGYRLDDFIAVIDKKCAEWMGDKQMEKHLTPDTLFGTKFEKYLNQKDTSKPPAVVRFERPEILHNGTPREGFGGL